MLAPLIVIFGAGVVLAVYWVSRLSRHEAPAVPDLGTLRVGEHFLPVVRFYMKAGYIHVVAVGWGLPALPEREHLVALYAPDLSLVISAQVVLSWPEADTSVTVDQPLRITWDGCIASSRANTGMYP